MAKVFGTITPSAGTGNKAINLGVSGITRLRIGASNTTVSYISRADGASVGATQKYFSITEGYGSTVPSNTFDILDNTGTVVYRASVSSISGTTLNWNVTTATITPTLLLDGDDY